MHGLLQPDLKTRRVVVKNDRDEKKNRRGWFYMDYISVSRSSFPTSTNSVIIHHVARDILVQLSRIRVRENFMTFLAADKMK